MDRRVSPDKSTNAGSGPVNHDWTVQRIIDWTTQHFRKCGCDSPRLDAEILLAHVRGCDRIQLYTRYAEILSADERACMRDLVNRRAQREPVAYLVGYREFFGLDFKVNRDVLIPRPDTEVLVLEALEKLRGLAAPRILEIGTGSGCVAITLASQNPGLHVTATDISDSALQIAEQNARQHRVSERITFRRGNLFEPLEAAQPYDMVISNPPYVAESDRAHLQPEILDHEPPQALFAGPDGMNILRLLVSQSSRFLKEGAWLLLELSPEQAPEMRRMFQIDGCWENPVEISDLSGQVRVIHCQRSAAVKISSGKD